MEEKILLGIHYQQKRIPAWKGANAVCIQHSLMSAPRPSLRSHPQLVWEQNNPSNWAYWWEAHIIFSVLASWEHNNLSRQKEMKCLPCLPQNQNHYVSRAPWSLLLVLEEKADTSPTAFLQALKIMMIMKSQVIQIHTIDHSNLLNIFLLLFPLVNGTNYSC